MGNISVDYDVLNQKGSPAWYSDTYANLPTPGYKGRMFISIDTFAFYRDNGTGWDLVGGPGTGTITGAGLFGQVTFFNGTDTIGGSTNLVWDNINNRLGINVASPTVTLDISGNVKATALIKSGGTSAQILLADGTITPTSTFQSAITISTIGSSGASTLVGGALNIPNYAFVSVVNALSIGITGTDITSSVVNSTTTPTITLNVPTASATNRGALSSADWTTFNNKQATLSLTTTGTSGVATLVSNVLNVPNYTNVGTVTSVAALTLGTSGTDLSSTVVNSTSTPVITLNVPTASATNRGALSTTDWSTFNNKQATISVGSPLTLVGALISMPAATTSVNGYLTSTDWNTFNNKSNTNGTVTSVVALTIGTTGIDITSTAVTTTTTPVITLNIPTASASNRGALSSTDWTTFNNKQSTITLTTTGTSGVATLIANTLNVPNYGSALSGYLPLTGGTLTGNLNGTSASFSGTGDTNLNINSTINAPYISFQKNSVDKWQLALERNTPIYGMAANDFGIYNATLSTIVLKLSNSTGAASFSSSVTLPNNTYLQFNNSSGTARTILTVDASNTTVIRHAASGGYFALQNFANTVNNLLIADSGAATFSSSVSVGTNLSLPNGRWASPAEINNAGADNGAIMITAGAGSANNQGFIGLYSDWDNSSNNVSKITFGTRSTERMRITSGGNVGIGTTSPDAQLVINGSSNSRFNMRAGDTRYGTLYADAGVFAIASITSIPLVFGINDVEKMRITSGGNVGIGTTAPTSKLEVIGSSSNINGYSDGSIQITGSSPIAFVGPSNLNPSLNRWGFKLREINDGDFSIYDYTASATRLKITSGGVVNVVSRVNTNNSTDNALFSLNSGGTLYTVGFSPNASTISSTTYTITTGATTFFYNGAGAATWTLPNPSGTNQMFWIKNASLFAITLNAYSGTSIINNASVGVSSITISAGATTLIQQDGNVKSYQLY